MSLKNKSTSNQTFSKPSKEKTQKKNRFDTVLQFVVIVRLIFTYLHLKNTSFISYCTCPFSWFNVNLGSTFWYFKICEDDYWL